jgi:sodium-independent sulfate anion transporter 11
MAVIHLFGPVSVFYGFWRISLADFVASMISFWLTIFVSAEIGIGAAAGWSVAWTMLRSAFVNPRIDTSIEDDNYSLQQAITRGVAESSSGHTEHFGIPIPSDTVVVHFTDSIFYPNAHRGKGRVLEAIKLVYDKVTTGNVDPRERSWSVAADRRIERLRKRFSIVLKDAPLSIVVWDFSMVPFVDVTAVLALREMKQDVRTHSGKGVQFRIVGLSKSVRERFLRAKWKLSDLEGWREEDSDVVYPSMERAVLDREANILEAVAIANEKSG